MVAKLTIQFSEWLALKLQNTFLLNTGEKQNQTRRCGTVYLGVDVLGVCEVFYVYKDVLVVQ